MPKRKNQADCIYERMLSLKKNPVLKKDGIYFLEPGLCYSGL